MLLNKFHNVIHVTDGKNDKFLKKTGGLLMMMVDVYKVGSEGYVCADASACLIFLDRS